MASTDPILITAAWVFPVARPPIRAGGVVLAAGQIVAVGSAVALAVAYPQAQRHDYPQHILTPGLVNAHTHLELSWLQGLLQPQAFWDWVPALRGLYPPAAELPGVVATAVRQGVQACWRHGVTCVGDITSMPRWVRPVLAEMNITGVSYGEVMAIGTGRGQAQARREAALAWPAGTMRLGLSPHAPYTVDGLVLRELVAYAQTQDLPLAMHLAEMPQEVDFLRDLSGPLGRDWPLMQTLGLLTAPVTAHAGGPIAWAADYGLLASQQPLILAHVNDADEAELDLLARAPARPVVAWCPRTRAFFGHDQRSQHPYGRLRRAGVQVCIATDSLASTPDFNLWAEVRHASQCYPEVSATAWLASVTSIPARGLGLAGQAGQLAPGLRADLSLFPTAVTEKAESTLAAVIATAPPATVVWIAGQQV